MSRMEQRSFELAQGCLHGSIVGPKLPLAFKPSGLETATIGELADLVYCGLYRDQKATTDLQAANLALWEALNGIVSKIEAFKQRDGKSWWSTREESLRAKESKDANVNKNVLSKNNELYIMCYLSSVLLLVRSPRCFLHSTQPALNLEGQTGFSLNEWQDQLPQQLKTTGRELATAYRFASSGVVTAVELFAADPTNAKQAAVIWLRQRSEALESLTTVFAACAKDSSAAQLNVPSDFLFNIFSSLVSMALYYQPERCADELQKLLGSATALEQKIGKRKLMSSFVSKVQRELSESTAGLTAPTGWTEVVREPLEQVLLKNPTDSKIENRRSFFELTGLDKKIAANTPATSSTLDNNGGLVMPTGDDDEEEGEGEEQKVWETPENPPAVCALEELRTVLFSTVPMEKDFNDDGASNTLRDIDQVVKVLRLISRSPLDLRGNIQTNSKEEKFGKGVPEDLAKELWYRRAGFEVDGGLASQRGKRSREDEDQNESSGKKKNSNVSHQPRAILPLKVGIDGSYQTDGVAPPLEDVWERHCK